MDGVILTLAQEGASVGCDSQTVKIYVDVLRAGKSCEKLCGCFAGWEKL
jgi:hypothetical protein